jgi:YbbR domain-containing protein
MSTMLSSLGKNLRSLFWAFLLSTAVWLAAVTASDPDEMHTYPNPVKVEVVGQAPNLIISGNLPQEVQLTLRAPRSIWDQLRARPDSIRAVIDLSGLGAGEHRISPQIQIDARPVRIVTVSPSSVTLTMEPLITSNLPLQSTLSGKAAIGYQPGELILDPKQIVLAGPQSIVSRVTQVRVVVNIEGIRESLDQTIPIEALDQNNRPVTNLTIQPQSAHVTLPVIRQGGFRDLAVKVIVRGQVATGYRLDSISVSPPVVTVYSSNPDLVNALPGVVETQPLELQAAKDNLNLRVSLNLPAGVSVVGQQTVLIQAGISPIQSSLTLSGERVELAGLPSGLSAQVSPATVDVILAGPLPILNTLTRQDVHVTVDVTGLTAGSYQLTPNVQILASNLTVESLLPGTVEVILVPNVSPTAKP